MSNAFYSTLWHCSASQLLGHLGHVWTVSRLLNSLDHYQSQN